MDISSCKGDVRVTGASIMWQPIVLELPDGHQNAERILACCPSCRRAVHLDSTYISDPVDLTVETVNCIRDPSE